MLPSATWTTMPFFLFQHIEGKWRNSPAYDLLPNEGFNGSHTTTVNNNGTPATDDMMEAAAKVGLSFAKAKEIIERVKNVVKESEAMDLDELLN